MLEVVAFVQSTGELSNFIGTVNCHFVESLQSGADTYGHVRCPLLVHILQLLPEMLFDIFDVVLLENEYDHSYINEEQRDDDKHEAEDDLRPKLHLAPLGVTEITPESSR